QITMMLLRHEAGHAFNYAYRLYKRPDWSEMFGSFSRPYRDSFRPNPFSRHFVRHIVHHQFGRTYAQKHPDEDFAETFAVWLTRLTRWSALDEEEVRALLTKLEQRAEALGLEFRGRHLAAKLMYVTALATALAMDFAHTERFTG